jgi:crossover junction endodeoxyribonuclease RusA
MNPIVVTLPPAVSANVYWRTRVAGNRAITYVSKEAVQFKAAVAKALLSVGCIKPIPGRVKVEVWAYPNRPLDFAKRQKKFGAEWDDSVRFCDIDNVLKVTLDAMKGLAFDDDVWVRQLLAQRMEPDAGGARVVVRISAIPTQEPQKELL